MIKIPQDKSIETRKPSIRLESSHSLTDTTVSEILAQAYLSVEQPRLGWSLSYSRCTQSALKINRPTLNAENPLPEAVRCHGELLKELFFLSQRSG